MSEEIRRKRRSTWMSQDHLYSDGILRLCKALEGPPLSGDEARSVLKWYEIGTRGLEEEIGDAVAKSLARPDYKEVEAGEGPLAPLFAAGSEVVAFIDPEFNQIGSMLAGPAGRNNELIATQFETTIVFACVGALRAATQTLFGPYSSGKLTPAGLGLVSVLLREPTFVDNVVGGLRKTGPAILGEAFTHSAPRWSNDSRREDRWRARLGIGDEPIAQRGVDGTFDLSPKMRNGLTKALKAYNGGLGDDEFDVRSSSGCPVDLLAVRAVTEVVARGVDQVI